MSVWMINAGCVVHRAAADCRGGRLHSCFGSRGLDNIREHLRAHHFGFKF